MFPSFMSCDRAGTSASGLNIFVVTLEIRAPLRIHCNNVCAGALQSLMFCIDEELVLLISKYRA